MSPKVIDDATRDARERELLNTALDVISEIGVSNLTIEKVVAQVPYSKGTVYNHFTCKEDMLTALCNNCCREIVELFARASAFEGSSREKMMALGYGYLLHSLLNPTRFMLVISAKTDAIREKSTQQRIDENTQLEAQLLECMYGVIQGAVDAGELTLPDYMTVKEVPFTFWSTGFGTIALLHQDVEKCGFREQLFVEHEFVNNANLILDGLGWTPNSREHDWQSCIERLKQTVFAQEVAELARLQAAGSTPSA
ncbi:MAG: TetR/AcrR family transcriptional regulator [Pontibacterium sp.]